MDALATRSDAIVAPPSTERRRLDGATAVHTPDERGYHFGNLLLIDDAPRPQDIPRWMAAWRTELGDIEGIGRLVWQWEAAEPAPAALAEAAEASGLTVECDEVLVLTDRSDGPSHPDARPVAGDDEWEGVAALIAGEDLSQLDFWRWRLGQHRALVDEGRGEWWAVFDGDAVACGAGIFWGDGLVRFQEVVTAPTHRRRGLASGLLVRMLEAHAHRGTVVIVAERGGDAARLYRRLGFAPVAVQQSITGPVTAPGNA